MGNTLSPCLFPRRGGTAVKLIFWGGAVRLLPESQPAGQLLFEYPDYAVCSADSFFIGRPVHALTLNDELAAGKTYFVIPIDRLPQRVLTAASISALSPAPASPHNLMAFGGEDSPFEYVKDAHERTLIKVKSEVIAQILSEGKEAAGEEKEGPGSPLCTTPELQKHYDQLVGPREPQWSPKLETISERKSRLSPSRMIRFYRER